jgi:hypothetical protein
MAKNRLPIKKSYHVTMVTTVITTLYLVPSLDSHIFLKSIQQANDLTCDTEVLDEDSAELKFHFY